MQLIITCDTHESQLLALAKPSVDDAELLEYLHAVSCSEGCVVYGIVYSEKNQELFGADKPAPVAAAEEVSPAPAAPKPWWKFW